MKSSERLDLRECLKWMKSPQRQRESWGIADLGTLMCSSRYHAKVALEQMEELGWMVSVPPSADTVGTKKLWTFTEACPQAEEAVGPSPQDVFDAESVQETQKYAHRSVRKLRGATDTWFSCGAPSRYTVVTFPIVRNGRLQVLGANGEMLYPQYLEFTVKGEKVDLRITGTCVDSDGTPRYGAVLNEHLTATDQERMLMRASWILHQWESMHGPVDER